ncbi:MAG: hypothetical protein QI199_04620 [Candidatus Korarchaeota archaeon]|nr:hypothetical protein [Candidatus Korarchaeota archaeon]
MIRITPEEAERLSEEAQRGRGYLWIIPAGYHLLFLIFGIAIELEHFDKFSRVLEAYRVLYNSIP